MSSKPLNPTGPHSESREADTSTTRVDLLESEDLLRNHAEAYAEYDYARLQTLHLSLIVRLKELRRSQG